MFGLKGQKPRQWGPLSAVQWAVRHNCDRLGFPYPSWAFAGMEGAGKPIDLVTGAEADTSTSMTWQQGRFGLENRTVHSGSPGTRWTTAPGVNALKTSSAGTYFVVALMDSPPATDAVILANSATATGFTLRALRNTDSDVYLRYTYYGVADYQTSNAGGYISVGDGQYRRLAVTSAGSSAALRFFSDATLLRAVTTGTYKQTTSDLFNFNGRLYPATSLLGAIPFAAVWPGWVATDTQVSELSERWLDLLTPAPRPVWFDMGAGGGTTKIAVLARPNYHAIGGGMR